MTCVMYIAVQMGNTTENKHTFWLMMGLALLAGIAALIVVRHVVFYDEFAEMTIAAGQDAPPPFPQWQRILLAGFSSLGFVAALGILLRRGWGVYLFIISFIMGQTFSFAIGQWGLPSFLTGLAVIVLCMNYLHRMK